MSGRARAQSRESGFRACAPNPWTATRLELESSALGGYTIHAAQMGQTSGFCLKVHHTMKSNPGNVDFSCRVVFLGDGMGSEEETAHIIL